MIHRIRSSIQLKLVLLIAVVLFFPGLWISQALSTYTIGITLTEGRGSALAALQGRLQVVQSSFRLLKDDLLELSLNPSLKLYTDAVVGGAGVSIRDDTQLVLSDFLKRHAYAQASIYQPDGQLLIGGERVADVVQTLSALPRLSEAQLQAMARLSSGQVFLDGFTTQSTNDQVTLWTPLYSAAGDASAYLGLRSSVGWLPDLMARGVERLAVYRLDGSFILGSSSQGSLLADVADVHFLTEHPFGTLETDRLAMAYGSLELPGAPFQTVGVVRSVPLSVLLEPVRVLQAQALLVSVASFTLLLTTLWLLTRPLIIPLRRLSEAATELKNQQFKVKLPPVRSSDEVGRLTQAFSEMATELGTSYAEIESRVQARTAELDAVARVSASTTTLLDRDVLIEAVQHQMQDGLQLAEAHVILPKSSVPLSDVLIEAQASGQAVYRREGAIETGALPLLASNGLVGLLHVSGRPGQPLSREVLRSLAGQIGIALRNVELYDHQVAMVAQLKELDQLKSRFLANMSHELRTPLNSVIGFTEVVLDQSFPISEEERTSYLKMALDSSLHLLNLINDVLDMSKIESGLIELFRNPTDVAKLVSDTLLTVQPLAAGKHVRLESDVADGLPLISIDGRRIKQVLINLLSNAIKFTPGGSVCVEARLDGTALHVLVRDTGAGIPTEDQEMVFMPFRQSREGLKQQVASTGLGLPISRALVEAHGGRLWLESTVGVGSTFHFSLPLEASKP